MPASPRRALATSSRLRRLVAAPLLLLWGTIGALGCASKEPVDPAAYLAQMRLQIDQRLAGRWRLIRFQPTDSLTMGLASLLNFQFDRLVVEFHNGRLAASSPGIHTERRYRIDAPQGDTFHLVVLDEQDVDYDGYCEFDSTGRLAFRIDSSTWRGQGVLQREDAVQ